MKQLLELPLNLTIVSPAHTPNWDLVSDVVNSCSRIYRSSKQCRSRYETVLIPREEGKVGARCAGIREILCAATSVAPGTPEHWEPSLSFVPGGQTRRVLASHC